MKCLSVASIVVLLPSVCCIVSRCEVVSIKIQTTFFFLQEKRKGNNKRTPKSTAEVRRPGELYL